MNTKGVNFQPSKRGQFSAAVDTPGVVLIRDGGLRLLVSWISCDIARFTPRWEHLLQAVWR